MPCFPLLRLSRRWMLVPQQTLTNLSEHGMVRHEAAEAVGALGDTESIELLSSFKDDRDDLVRESCEVALDAADYWATTCVSTQ